MSSGDTEMNVTITNPKRDIEYHSVTMTHDELFALWQYMDKEMYNSSRLELATRDTDLDLINVEKAIMKLNEYVLESLLIEEHNKDHGTTMKPILEVDATTSIIANR